MYEKSEFSHRLQLGAPTFLCSRGETLTATKVELKPGATQEVELVVPLATTPGPPTVPLQGDGALWIAGWAGVAAGGAAGLGAAIAAGIRAAALSELESACPGYDGGICRADANSIADRGAAASTAANVLLVTAGVAGAVGVTLLVVAATDDDNEEPAAELAVGGLAGGAGLRFRLRF